MVEGAEQLDILYPVFAMVALTYLVWLRLFSVRIPLILSGKVRVKYYVAREGDPPPARERQPTHHLANLFELPVLFYVLVGLALITGAADPVAVTMAWVFVVARAAHALVHLSYNKPNHRFVPYLLSSAVLLAMWLRFFGFVLARS